MLRMHPAERPAESGIIRATDARVTAQHAVRRGGDTAPVDAHLEAAAGPQSAREMLAALASARLSKDPNCCNRLGKLRSMGMAQKNKIVVQALN